MHIDLDETGDLIHGTGEHAQRVRAQRSFPWSAPDRFVVLRDGEGEEIETIDDLQQLPAKSRGAIEAWLQRHSLVPKVLRVIEVRPVNAAWRFELDTDRGPAVVLLKEREDLRPLEDGRLLLRDGDGQTYEFGPHEEYDKHSRAELTKLV